MKYLIILAILSSFSVYAQSFSPSATATSLASPAATATPRFGAGQNAGFTSPPVDTGSIPNTNNGLNVPAAANSNAYNMPPSALSNPYNVPGAANSDSLNTAPTSIPTDTSLLNNNLESIPTNNPPNIQAQEFDAFGNPNTTTIPGSESNSGMGTGTGMGSGASGSEIVNPTSPISSP